MLRVGKLWVIILLSERTSGDLQLVLSDWTCVAEDRFSVDTAHHVNAFLHDLLIGSLWLSCVMNGFLTDHGACLLAINWQKAVLRKFVVP